MSAGQVAAVVAAYFPESVRKARPLGDAQRYILESIALDSLPGDARSRRVAESLERRGLAYTNYGRWYVSDTGRAALAAVQP